MVSGHVDHVGTLIKITQRGRDRVLSIRCGKQISAETVKKGSITIDGISLTVTDVSKDSLEVNIIPHTWDNTNLHKLKQGDPVNLESDIIGKYVRKAISEQTGIESSITEETLRNAGF